MIEDISVDLVHPFVVLDEALDVPVGVTEVVVAVPVARFCHFFSCLFLVREKKVSREKRKVFRDGVHSVLKTSHEISLRL